MPNLFIKTDYWTRAQKPWVKLYVNLFCEEGKLGAGNPQSHDIEWWASWSIHHCSSVASLFWHLRLKETVCGLPCCVSTGS